MEPVPIASAKDMRVMGHARTALVCGVVTAALASPSLARLARADEPIAPGEPRLMSETAEITSVVDAFDTDDPFDLNLMVGFHQSWKSANIRRETNISQPGLSTGGVLSANENIASYKQTTSTLDMGADIGIYKDLAIIFRLPLILSDNRSLGDLGGSSKIQSQLLADPTGGQLFSIPFKSPTRSGIDYFSVGLDWAIFHQQRDWTKPTWVIGVDGRFGVGAPLHACNANAPAGQPQCLDPSNPTSTTSRSPGISRGMDGVEVRTVFSRRYGYVEPYMGFSMLAEFPESSTDFGQTNGLAGSLLNHPPLLGTFSTGVEVIPWERREQFQRLVGDLRLSATYHSAGREYTELFDALGSSQAHSLRTPNPSSYGQGSNGTSQAMYGSGTAASFAGGIPFTGITDQQAFGSMTLGGTATWQAGEYVKFLFGLGFTYNQTHLITAADACNPNLGGGNIYESGPCKTNTATSQTATGIPNPNHRDVIDLPGNRFSSDGATVVDLYISGVVMF